jgi:transketolase
MNGNEIKNDVNWEETAYTMANSIRRRVLEYVIKSNGGYLCQACSAAEIFAALYVKVLKLGSLKAPLNPRPFGGVPGPNNPNSFTGADFHGPKTVDSDRFYLSPTQYSAVLYAALVEVGRMAPEGLAQFNQDGSSVEMLGAAHSPGMEVMSASLGQTISQAAGIAWARKTKGETGRVYVFLGDGELQSGQTWEAIQSMAFYKLDNMYVYVDFNRHQCDGKVADVMNIEPIDKRLEAFGARVFRIDGHDIETLAALGQLKPDGRPTIIIAETEPWRGMDIVKERCPKFHYIRFNNAEERMRYQKFLDNWQTI